MAQASPDTETPEQESQTSRERDDNPSRPKVDRPWARNQPTALMQLTAEKMQVHRLTVVVDIAQVPDPKLRAALTEESKGKPYVRVDWEPRTMVADYVDTLDVPPPEQDIRMQPALLAQYSFLA